MTSDAQPATRTAFVFPGQGAQKVGMGRDWAEQFPAAKRAFEEADDALDISLSSLCWEGPEEDLQLTANTQPALLATCIAMFRALDAEGHEAALMAGHSLGEYTALVAAGALGFADALRLVRRRGELMQDAVPVGEGGMAAIIGLDDDAVQALAAEAAEGADEVCAVANLNSPGQVVLAGHAAAVERAVTLAQERGAKKAQLLKVSAPFHCSLMRPARDALAPLLAATPFHDPRVPVVTNVDARPVTTGEAARDALVRQVDSPVRWVESARWMAGPGGMTHCYEIGPSKVLSGLVRRSVDGVKTLTIDAPAKLTKLDEDES